MGYNVETKLLAEERINGIFLPALDIYNTKFFQNMSKNRTHNSCARRTSLILDARRALSLRTFQM